MKKKEVYRLPWAFSGQENVPCEIEAPVPCRFMGYKLILCMWYGILNQELMKMAKSPEPLALLYIFNCLIHLLFIYSDDAGI